MMGQLQLDNHCNVSNPSFVLYQFMTPCQDQMNYYVVIVPTDAVIAILVQAHVDLCIAVNIWQLIWSIKGIAQREVQWRGFRNCGNSLWVRLIQLKDFWTADSKQTVLAKFMMFWCFREIILTNANNCSLQQDTRIRNDTSSLVTGKAVLWTMNLSMDIGQEPDSKLH